MKKYMLLVLWVLFFVPALLAAKPTPVKQPQVVVQKTVAKKKVAAKRVIQSKPIQLVCVTPKPQLQAQAKRTR